MSITSIFLQKQKATQCATFLRPLTDFAGIEPAITVLESVVLPLH
nr:MAG TPA: hypothetical protein [Caudoviricetes sp.]